MLHSPNLGYARMAELTKIANASHASRRHNRGSPGGIARIRLVIARALVLTGAKLHGTEPAVIGRVVILDPCGEGPQGFRPAA